MANKKKILLYEIVNGILGMLLMFSLMATVFAHIRLGLFDQPGADVALFFSEQVRQEQALLQDVRLIGAAGAVALTCLTVLSGVRYFQLHEDHRWESKKSLGAGVIMFIAGPGLYLATSDIILDSIGLSLVVVGLVFVVGNSAFLLATGEY